MIDHVHALLEGYRLQEYTITGTLGFGGFGITYSAHDNNLDMMVAIKEYLPSELAVRVEGSTVSAKSEQDKESFDWGLERFIDEGRAVARFNHPNIIRIHRFFEQNSTGYIVMELVDGETLSSMLEEKGTLDESQIRACLWPVLDGLNVVHATGYIHRDIKPQNIMINGDGVPVLLDFGAARMAVGGRTRSLTSIMTPGFAPLEQYQTTGQGPWTDIYALGAVMYKCITGKKPQDALDRVSNDTLQPPGGDPHKSYSPEMLKGIVAALAVSPGDRPQSIDAWLEILDSPDDNSTRLMPGRPASPAPQSPVSAPGNEKTGASGKWLAIAILSLLLAGAGTFWWYKEQSVTPVATNITEPIEKEQRAKPQAESERPEELDEPLASVEPATSTVLNSTESPAEVPVTEDETPAATELSLSDSSIPAPGSMLKDCDQCPEMVVIPAGSFLMGSPVTEHGRMQGELEQQRVSIDKAFAMGVYEVTFLEYMSFADATGRAIPDGVSATPGIQPVFNVSWENASAYAEWLSVRTGQHYRLPTGTEWEYAARGGTDTTYWWGQEVGANQAHCRGCGSQWNEQQAAPVGSFAANQFGLHEVHGNVSEWVGDCSNPGSESGCRQRVIRGGSYVDRPQNARAAYRYVLNSKQSRNYLGFRLARDL